jgi:hypothetical protein
MALWNALDNYSPVQEELIMGISSNSIEVTPSFVFLRIYTT